MKKKLIRIALIIFIISVFSAIGTYLYVFHKPHRNIAKEKPAYQIEATQLLSDFISDEAASYEKYGNTILQLTGKVADISVSHKGASITLIDPFEGVNCSFDSTEVVQNKDTFNSINIGQKISLKGQCDGFDMIMGVVLTRCVLTNE